MSILKLVTLLILFSLPSLAQAETPDVVFSGAYAYETAQHQHNGAVFMNVENKTSSAIKIIAAKSDVAQMVELHTHSMGGGHMSMYPVDYFEAAANSMHKLKATGDHIMLMMLHERLEAGATFEVQVTLDNAHIYTVPVTVRSLRE